MLKILIAVFLFVSCNAFDVIGDFESKIDDDFSESDSNNSDNQNDRGASNLSCPNNYLYISGSSQLGTNDFCVMQFEAKNSSGVPVSTATLSPWTNIDLASAKNACTSLGAGYDLISNPEWMTIAREIENISSNWTSGTVGDGCIYMGHNGQADSTPNCHYMGATSTLDFGMVGTRDILARLIINNGQEIWDFSGNASEWVDWNIGGTADIGPNSCSVGNFEFNSINCTALAFDDYSPSDNSLSSVNGVGKLSSGSGGAAIRGGAINEAASVGIYRLNLSQNASVKSPFLGFRCVYRGVP